MKPQVVLDLLAAIRDGDFDANIELSEGIVMANERMVMGSMDRVHGDDTYSCVARSNEFIFIRPPRSSALVGEPAVGFVFPDADQVWEHIVEFIKERDRWVVLFEGYPTHGFDPKKDESWAELSDDVVVYGPFIRDVADATLKALSEDGEVRHGRWGVIPVTVR